MDAGSGGNGSGWILFAVTAACYMLWQRSVQAEAAAQASSERLGVVKAQRAAAWARGDAAAAERDAALAEALAMERERDDALKLVRQARAYLGALTSRVAVLRGECARVADELSRARRELSLKAEAPPQPPPQPQLPMQVPPHARGEDVAPPPSRRRRRRYLQA